MKLMQQVYQRLFVDSTSRVRNDFTESRASISADAEVWGLGEKPANENLYPVLKTVQYCVGIACAVMLTFWSLTGFSAVSSETSWILSLALFYSIIVLISLVCAMCERFSLLATTGALSTMKSAKPLFPHVRGEHTFSLDCTKSEAFDRVLLVLSRMKGVNVCAIDVFGGRISALSAKVSDATLEIQVAQGVDSTEVRVRGDLMRGLLIECGAKKNEAGFLASNFRLTPELPAKLRRNENRLRGCYLALITLSFVLLGVVCGRSSEHSMIKAESLRARGLISEALKEADLVVARDKDSGRYSHADALERRGLIKLRQAEGSLLTSRLAGQPDKAADLEMLTSAQTDFEAVAGLAESTEVAQSTLEARKAKILAWKGDFKGAEHSALVAQEYCDVTLYVKGVENLQKGNLEAAYISWAECDLDFDDDQVAERKAQLLAQMSKTRSEYKSIAEKLTPDDTSEPASEPIGSAELPLVLLVSMSVLFLVTYQLKEKRSPEALNEPPIASLPRDLTENIESDDSWWDLEFCNSQTISIKRPETLNSVA